MAESDLSNKMIHSTNESIIFLKNACIKRQNNIIIDNANIRISKGEFVYLVGKTGAGKSSLFQTIYGALPFSGEVGLVAETNLASIKPTNVHMLRRKLGIVFQDFVLLYDRNVYKNLIFTLKANNQYKRKTCKTRIEEVLSLVGISDLINKSLHQLSGGEKQRIVIARALLNNPEIIIADEPTGNLDPDTSDEIVELLKNISREKKTAILFATHDYRIINNYPARVIRLHDGRLFDQMDSII